MDEFMDFWINRFGSFVSFLGGLEIVGGVSLLSFCIAIIVVGVRINSFLLRGK